MEILDFEKEIGIELEVKNRGLKSSLPIFYVSFPKSEIASKGMLIGKFGNGNTIDEALKDYADELSEETIIFNAYTSSRKEIKSPILVHTKLLGK